MAGTNDFLPLAVGGSANVVDQATFAALSSLLSNGFQSGVANSAQINKIFRQSSTVSSAIAQIIADNNVNATDDGNVTTFKTNFMAALAAQLAISNASIQGDYKNLQASASGTSASISVSADEIIVENASNAYKTLRAVSLTVSGSANGANGLDTGSLAANTWYAVYVIYNGTTTAGLLSLSATAPTMPSGYTHKARVGWIRTDGTVNKYPLSFKQLGRKIRYVVATGSNVTALPQIIAGTQGSTSVPTWIAASVSNVVPSTATSIYLSLFIGTTANQDAMVAPNNAYGARSSATNPPPLAAYDQHGGNAHCVEFLLESTSVYYAATYSTTFLACMGWEDN